MKTVQIFVTFVTLFLLFQASFQQNNCGQFCEDSFECTGTCKECVQETCQTPLPLMLGVPVSGTVTPGDIWAVYELELTTFPTGYQYVEFEVNFTQTISAEAIVSVVGPFEADYSYKCELNLAQKSLCRGYIPQSDLFAGQFSLVVKAIHDQSSTPIPFIAQFFYITPIVTAVSVNATQYFYLSSNSSASYFSFEVPEVSKGRVVVELSVQSTNQAFVALLNKGNLAGLPSRGLEGYFTAGSSEFCQYEDVSIPTTTEAPETLLFRYHDDESQSLDDLTAINYTISCTKYRDVKLIIDHKNLDSFETYFLTVSGTPDAFVTLKFSVEEYSYIPLRFDVQNYNPILTNGYSELYSYNIVIQNPNGNYEIQSYFVDYPPMAYQIQNPILLGSSFHYNNTAIIANVTSLNPDIELTSRFFFSPEAGEFNEFSSEVASSGDCTGVSCVQLASCAPIVHVYVNQGKHSQGSIDYSGPRYSITKFDLNVTLYQAPYTTVSPSSLNDYQISGQFDTLIYAYLGDIGVSASSANYILDLSNLSLGSNPTLTLNYTVGGVHQPGLSVSTLFVSQSYLHLNYGISNCNSDSENSCSIYAYIAQTSCDATYEIRTKETSYVYISLNGALDDTYELTLNLA